MAYDLVYKSGENSTTGYTSNYPDKSVYSGYQMWATDYFTTKIARGGNFGSSTVSMYYGTSGIVKKATSINYRRFQNSKLTRLYGEHPTNNSSYISCAVDYRFVPTSDSTRGFIGWFNSSDRKEITSVFSSATGIGYASESSNYFTIGKSYPNASLVAVFGIPYNVVFSFGCTGSSKIVDSSGTATSTTEGSATSFFGANAYFSFAAPGPSFKRKSIGFKEATEWEFARPGYVFKGWNTESDGSGSHYNVGDELTRLVASADDVGVQFLYAEWVKETKVSITNNHPFYGTVSVEDSEGNVLASQDEVGNLSVSVEPGSKIYICTDYDSKFYSLTIDGANYDEGRFEITVGSTDETHNCVISERPLYSVSLVYDSGKGEVTVSPDKDSDSGWLSQRLTFTVRSNKGYSPNTFTVVDENGDTVIDNSKTAWADGDSAETLSAITSNVTATLTFNVGSFATLARLDGACRVMGSVSPSEQRNVSSGTQVSFSATASDNIFVFDGWYKSDGTKKSGLNPYTLSVDEDTVLFAKFKLAADVVSESTTTIGYASGSTAANGSISIVGNNADSGTASFTGDTGREIVLSATVANGMKFVGWYDSTNPNTALSTSTKFRTFLKTRTILAKFASDTSSLLLWEGADARMTATWRSKTYVSSKPFDPACCRVDATGYSGLNLKVDTFSSPDVGAKATGSATLSNIANQDARRLPMRRPERYLQVEVENDAEVDAVLVGTSMEGLAV